MVQRKSWLAPKKILDPQEYLQYREQKKLEKREKLLKGISSKAEGLKERDRLSIRKRSVGGRISSTFQKTVQLGIKGITRTLYDRGRLSIQQSKADKLTPTGGVKTGKRGRPSGSTKYFHPRTGNPIGVYEHRKAMSQIRALERIRAKQEGRITPMQRATIRKMEYQRQVSQQQRRANDPFFGTDGNVQLGSIMQQINDATNLVD